MFGTPLLKGQNLAPRNIAHESHTNIDSRGVGGDAWMTNVQAALGHKLVFVVMVQDFVLQPLEVEVS